MTSMASLVRNGGHHRGLARVSTGRADRRRLLARMDRPLVREARTAGPALDEVLYRLAPGDTLGVWRRTGRVGR